MDKKYIETLKINDTVIIYVPVCDESHIGYTHGKFVKAKCGKPWEDGGVILFFDRKIQSEPGDFFSSIPTNQLGANLASPLIFAVEEFEELRGDRAKMDEFFKNYPHPNDFVGPFSVCETMRICWQQTKNELKRMLKLKKPIIVDMSHITVLP